MSGVCIDVTSTEQDVQEMGQECIGVRAWTWLRGSSVFILLVQNGLGTWHGKTVDTHRGARQLNTDINIISCLTGWIALKPVS